MRSIFGGGKFVAPTPTSGARFSGSSLLSSIARQKSRVVALLGGTSTLTALAILSTNRVNALLAGISSLTARPRHDKRVGARLPGTSLLRASGTIQASGDETIVCDRNATTATFAAQVSAATAGQTVCLASGNYGTWTGTNKAITIAPQPGADVTMSVNISGGNSGWTIDGGHTEISISANGMVREALPFTSPGITLDGVVFAQTTNPAQNITLKRCWFTDIVKFDSDPASPLLDAYWTIDRCVWNNVGTFSSPDLSIPESCFQIWGHHFIVKNCLFYDSLADGAKLSGGTDCVVQDCEFNAMHPHTHPEVHSDALQWNGATASVIVRNYFHDFEQACSGFDGMGSNTITDNVIDSTGGRAAGHWLTLGADNPGSVVNHNTVIGGPLIVGSKPSDPLSISFLTNNIAENIALVGIAGGAAGVPSSNTKNMVPSGATGTNINGTPTFVGGATPSTYQGYKLTVGSSGHNAGSDGLDVGARIA